ncbi:MAG: FHA domain-containing protein, partial [Gemmatimonadetes bacterium]|nr:FHA domain-containing protein [Gemmatimonadota bacterium]
TEEETAMSQSDVGPELAKTINISEQAAAAASSASRKTQVMHAPSEIEGVAWLVGLEGGQKGRMHQISGERATIGASADCDVTLTEEHISELHASIRLKDRTFVVTDFDSTNGTYVNDTSVDKETLSDGDTLRFGSSEWIFKCVVFEAD